MRYSDIFFEWNGITVVDGAGPMVFLFPALWPLMASVHFTGKRGEHE
jgi:hypothetical protein